MSKKLFVGSLSWNTDDRSLRAAFSPHGEITDRYARALEAWIREDPAGWWWSHKRWKLTRGAA